MKIVRYFCGFLLVASSTFAYGLVPGEEAKVEEYQHREIAAAHEEDKAPTKIAEKVIEEKKEHTPAPVTVKKPVKYVKHNEMKNIVSKLSNVVTALASMKKEQEKRDGTFNQLVETKISDAVDAIKHSFDTKFAKLKKEITEKMAKGEKRVKNLVNNIDDKVIKHEVAQQLASVRTEYGDFIKNREKREKLRVLLSDAIDSGRL